jgi:parallel beta-helix repeat protein
MTFRTTARRGSIHMMMHWVNYPRPFIYLNTVTGSNSNDGLTPATPKLTLDAAMNVLDASYSSEGTIHIHAPEANPLLINTANSHEVFNAGNMALVPWPGESVWYGENWLHEYTSGWNSEGGGVYSRTDQPTTSILWIETMLDSNSFFTPLTSGGATTTPAAGTFGVSGGNLYVRLPGDADPNDHTIVQPRNTTTLRTQNAAKLEVRGGIIRYTRSSIVFMEGASQVTLRDCVLEYALANCAEVSNAATGAQLTAYNSIARRAVTNDGWNIHSNDTPGQQAVFRLYNCEGAYCGDEGVSPHENSELYINGGRYHHNGQSGLAAVDESVIEVRNARFDHNNLTSVPDAGGILLLNTSNGTIENCQVDNNNGPGLNCATSGDVVVTGLNSFDNADADVLCS